MLAVVSSAFLYIPTFRYPRCNSGLGLASLNNIAIQDNKLPIASGQRSHWHVKTQTDCRGRGYLMTAVNEGRMAYHGMQHVVGQDEDDIAWKYSAERDLESQILIIDRGKQWTTMEDY